MVNIEKSDLQAFGKRVNIQKAVGFIPTAIIFFTEVIYK